MEQDIEFKIKMHSVVMEQLEMNGYVDTYTTDLQDLDSRIPEGTDYVKIINSRNTRNIYVPIQKNGSVIGYSHLGRQKR